MESDKLIPVEKFCLIHKVEFSFIQALDQYGIVEIVVIENVKFIPLEKLGDVEKIARMHYDLGINLEGIDVIFNLLHKIDSLQQELSEAQNILQHFGPEED